MEESHEEKNRFGKTRISRYARRGVSTGQVRLLELDHALYQSQDCHHAEKEAEIERIELELYQQQEHWHETVTTKTPTLPAERIRLEVPYPATFGDIGTWCRTSRSIPLTADVRILYDGHELVPDTHIRQIAINLCLKATRDLPLGDFELCVHN